MKWLAKRYYDKEKKHILNPQIKVGNYLLTSCYCLLTLFDKMKEVEKCNYQDIEYLDKIKQEINAKNDYNRPNEQTHMKIINEVKEGYKKYLKSFKK